MKKIKKTESGQNIIQTDKKNLNESITTENKTENGKYIMKTDN